MSDLLKAKTWLASVFLMAVVVGEFYSQPVNRDLRDLATAERAFAAETVKVGFRDGFIKYFADDGIGFGPHPERTKEVLQKRPAPTGPRTLVFNWQPMFGDISAAGDMGFTTGPVLFTPQGPDAKPPWHGIYFSVWQKQADATWKVAVDMGVDTPQAVAPIDTEFTAAIPVKRTGKNPTKDTSSDGYRQLDWNLSGRIATESPLKGYASHLDTEFRLHRKGIMPVTTRAGLASAIKQTKFEFIDGKIASSNDLAFTYGKYTTVNEPEAETGYYVHVWRRDAAGKWKLVIDVQNPLPKENK
jgi:ketosteroid isomerase-like protein